MIQFPPAPAASEKRVIETMSIPYGSETKLIESISFRYIFDQPFLTGLPQEMQVRSSPDVVSVRAPDDATGLPYSFSHSHSATKEKYKGSETCPKMYRK